MGAASRSPAGSVVTKLVITPTFVTSVLAALDEKRHPCPAPPSGSARSAVTPEDVDELEVGSLGAPPESKLSASLVEQAGAAGDRQGRIPLANLDRPASNDLALAESGLHRAIGDVSPDATPELGLADRFLVSGEDHSSHEPGSGLPDFSHPRADPRQLQRSRGRGRRRGHQRKDCRRNGHRSKTRAPHAPQESVEVRGR